MDKTWRERAKDIERKGNFISFIQTYFKTPEGTKETRSFEQLCKDVAIDIKHKKGVKEVERIFINYVGNIKS